MGLEDPLLTGRPRQLCCLWAVNRVASGSLGLRCGLCCAPWRRVLETHMGRCPDEAWSTWSITVHCAAGGGDSSQETQFSRGALVPTWPCLPLGPGSRHGFCGRGPSDVWPGPQPASRQLGLAKPHLGLCSAEDIASRGQEATPPGDAFAMSLPRAGGP